MQTRDINYQIMAFKIFKNVDVAWFKLGRNIQPSFVFADLGQFPVADVIVGNYFFNVGVAFYKPHGIFKQSGRTAVNFAE